MTPSIAKGLFTVGLCGLTALFNVCATDAASAGPRNYTLHDTLKIGNIAIPRCTARNGTPVKYVLTSGNNIFGPVSYMILPGSLSFNLPADMPQDSGAYIILPRNHTDKMTPLSYALTVAHECAHHILGHTEDIQTPGHGGSLRTLQTYEEQADCEAPRIMSNHYMMSRKTIKAAIADMASLLSQKSTFIHGSARARQERMSACLQ